MTDKHYTDLAIRGNYNAMLAEHCELIDRVTALEARVAALDALISPTLPFSRSPTLPLPDAPHA